MSDITTRWSPEKALGDWEPAYGDLVSGDDLDTAILISLFTDRQANADDDIDGTDRRGWWGDSGAEDNMGSRLWLLSRRALNQQTATEAERYAKEALAWLTEDEVVESIGVSSLVVYPKSLFLSVTYQRPDSRRRSVTFSWVWESVNAV